MDVASLNLSKNDRTLLLEFQKARFALGAFPQQAHAAYTEAKEKLKKISAPALADLIRRTTQEVVHTVTPDSSAPSIELLNDISDAENELYELSFQFGNNTGRNETDKIQ